MHPKIKVRGQYIKDLSFENPNAPRVFLMISKKPPEISISVNVASAALPVQTAEGEPANLALYEVTLHINIDSTVDNISAFVCEMKYCGVFSVEGDNDQDQVKKALLISAPAILFPFVREVIAKVTAAAGFPPLMLEVIDFEEMYEKQLGSGSADAGEKKESK